MNDGDRHIQEQLHEIAQQESLLNYDVGERFYGDDDDLLFARTVPAAGL